MERSSQAITDVRERIGAWLRVALILIILAFLFFVAGGGISHNAKWQIDQINISGTDTGTADQIRALVEQKLAGNYYMVYARGNSYLFPKNEINQIILDTFPRLTGVSSEKINDNSIAIVVSERRPYALWCGEMYHPELSSYPDCWFVDKTGFVFDRAPTFSRGVYVQIFGKLVQNYPDSPLQSALPFDRFTSVNDFAELLKASVGQVNQLEINPEGESEVVLQSSVQFPFLAEVRIKFLDSSEPATLVKNLLAAIPVQFPDNTSLKKKLSYIDMRFGNKVIFGFEN